MLGAFARDRKAEGATRPRPINIAGALLAAALIAWIIVVERMRGMDGGPGTDLGALGWYRRHLGDDDGGDDAALACADGARLRCGSSRERTARGHEVGCQTCAVRRRLLRDLDGVRASLAYGIYRVRRNVSIPGFLALGPEAGRIVAGAVPSWPPASTS